MLNYAILMPAKVILQVPAKIKVAPVSQLTEAGVGKLTGASLGKSLESFGQKIKANLSRLWEVENCSHIL